jgi:sugar diacid utilization regulator/putative methionine-R-sulfoxide reductase with GAF domain
VTAEPARAEPRLACAEPEPRRAERPDGSPSWLVRALTMLDSEGRVGPDRPAIFRALAAALSMRTGGFVVLDDQPGRWTVRALGSDATAADAEWAVRAAAGGLTGTHGPWVTAGADAGECAVAVAGPPAAADVVPVLATARRMLREARLIAAAVEAEAEVDALRIVAGRILRARELDDALLAVTNETLRLVASDIAGVMLRDGDEIFMRSCAGNQRADTAHLRMRRGQGLAGLVFATGEAAKVDDYLRNDLISDDFHHLARLERTRSALAAPLTVDGDVIGVLEVWRRRESQFTPAEIHRLVALAELAAIALDNARLHALSEEGARAVEAAHQAAEAQLGRVEHALGVQQELIEAIVDGSQLPGILRIVGERSGCQVALFDAELEHVACWPPDSDVQALAGAVREVQRCGGDDRQTHWKPCDGRVVAIHPVLAGREPIGFICLYGEAALDRDQAELTARQASLTVALNYLEEQAATKARASLREEILLHLLRGSSGERRAAIARARYLQVDLRGPLRVAVCRLTGLQDAARAAAWSGAHEDRVRRRLLTICETILAETGWLRLAAINGDDVIALIRSAPSAELRPALAAVVQALAEELPAGRMLWGISSPHTTPHELDLAFDEAMTAAQALRLDSIRNVAIYEDLGILGLLIAGPKGTPLADFASTTLGTVLQHDAQNGTSLMDTLRAYLDTNCNQRETAAKLFVHAKTVKYRLEVIQKLTGLSLSEHHDRMRADIAVRALDLN